MTELRLTEGGDPIIRSLDDETGDALAFSQVVSAIRLGGGDWEIAPLNKVGVASIGEVTVRIEPKVDIARLLFLLGYAAKPGWLDNTVTMTEVNHLVPALAQAFVDQSVQALERGLLQGYTEIDDSLTVLRGRLRDQDQLRRQFGIAIPLLVRFDDHTVDIVENQILRAATEMLLQTPDVSTQTRARLRHLRQVLGQVTPTTRGAPLPSWAPNRLNERYHVALWLAEVLLRRNAVDNLPGDAQVGGFLVDMWKVYEDFATKALTGAFRRHGGWCRTQDRHYLDTDDQVLMKPDLVWYLDSAPVAVIDAKYKAEKPAGFPDADLYQMLAYCTALELEHGHLIYAKGNASEVTHTVRHTDISIHAHTLDLAAAPRDLLLQVDAFADHIAQGRSPAA